MDLLDQHGGAPGTGTAATAQDSSATRSSVVSTRAAPRRVEVVLGRVIDVVVAAGVLIVLAPLLVMVALAVRLTSPGPALFRQERLGRDRRRFRLYKFRTMRADSSEDLHREYVQTLIASGSDGDGDGLYKLTVDHRITSLGRLLRSFSIDEIPQLLNVLRGEMALVGPRPVIAYEAELYPDSYVGRFAVTPGLTGLWQVSGRNERTYDEMVQFDLEYAERRSLRLDLEILVRTIPVVLGRRGVA